MILVIQLLFLPCVGSALTFNHGCVSANCEIISCVVFCICVFHERRQLSLACKFIYRSEGLFYITCSHHLLFCQLPLRP